MLSSFSTSTLFASRNHAFPLWYSLEKNVNQFPDPRTLAKDSPCWNLTPGYRKHWNRSLPTAALCPFRSLAVAFSPNELFLIHSTGQFLFKLATKILLLATKESKHGAPIKSRVHFSMCYFNIKFLSLNNMKYYVLFCCVLLMIM